MTLDAASAKTLTHHGDHNEDCCTPPVIEPINDKQKLNLAEILNSKNEKGSVVSVKSSRKTLKKY